MEKKIKIVHKDRQFEEDTDFWKNKSPKEKLEAVQYLREQWIEKLNNQSLYDESRKRLRRFYKVVKKK